MTTALIVVGCVVGYFAIGSFFVRRVLPRIGRRLWRKRIDYLRRYRSRDIAYYLDASETGDQVKVPIIAYAWLLATAWPAIPLFFVGRAWWNLVHEGFLAAFERNNPKNMSDEDKLAIYHISPPIRR